MKDFIVLNSSQAGNKSKEFYEYVQAPFLTDIKIKYPESLGINLESQIPEKIGDLFSSKPIVITGKYTGDLEKAKNNQLASNKFMNTLFLICLVGFSWAVAMGLVKQSVRKKNKQTRITLYIITTIIIGAFFIVILSKIPNS